MRDCVIHLAKISFVIVTMISSGCQLVQLRENQLSQSLDDKMTSILTSQHLSSATANIIYLTNFNQKKCLAEFDQCLKAVDGIHSNDKDAYHAALSELYLAKALELESQCQLTKASQCGDQELRYLDQSLRHSYHYLFASINTPSHRAFDYRQNQVRIFYNVALSRLLSRYSELHPQSYIPDSISIAGHQYKIDTSQFPHLKDHRIAKLKSSYNMNFSGFHTVNRTDGLGAEFVIEFAEHYKNNGFILDPVSFYQNSLSPNIHAPKVLPLSALMVPEDERIAYDTQNTNFKIRLIDPYLYHQVEVNQADYTLTANYSAPFGYWLAQNHLGKAGYWTLLNKENDLLMPHLYMLEPYNPNKKVIVFIHGLASSPEAWVSLTNDIMGDQELRDHYQVWQIFYSTNMPIFESRYQIYTLLTQAFQNIEINNRWCFQKYAEIK